MVLASWTGAGGAAASDCDRAQDRSPATDFETRIAFVNDTPYAFKVYWSNHDGMLTAYDLVQPHSKAAYATYIAHRWFLEVYTPERTVCLGPVSAFSVEACEARIRHYGDAVFGLDADNCDF